MTIGFLTGLIVNDHLAVFQIHHRLILHAMSVLVLFSIFLNKYRNVAHCLLFLLSILCGCHHANKHDFLAAAKTSIAIHQLNKKAKWECRIDDYRITDSGVRVEAHALIYDQLYIENINLKLVMFLSEPDSSIKKKDHIIFTGRIFQIKHTNNAHSFNAEKFYKAKGIHFNAFPKEYKIKKSSSPKGGIHQLRSRIKIILAKHITTDSAFKIMTAMVLGDRSESDKSLLQSFSNAGAIHVLAVSGLHVGIIFTFLNLLFRPLSFITQLRFAQNLFVLTGILGYVALTGYQSSALRAGLMLSLYILLKAFGKSPVNFNIVSLVALAMLLYNPGYIDQLGFQFSFLAITSILFFYPYYVQTIQPRNKLLKYIMDIVCISVFAQLMILPIALKTFNQFPNAFILSSVIAIPMSFIIVGLSFCLIALELIIPTHGILIKSVIGNLLDYCVQYFIASIQFIEALPFSLSSNIYIDNSSFLLLSSAIIFLMISIKQGSKKYLFICLFILMCLPIKLVYSKATVRTKVEIIINHRSQSSLILFVHGGLCQYYFESKDNKAEPTDLIQKIANQYYCQESRNISSTIKACNGLYNFYDKCILIHPETKLITPTDREYAIAIINPDTDLDHLLTHHKINEVCVDGLTPYWKIKDLVETSRKHSLEPIISYSDNYITIEL